MKGSVGQDETGEVGRALMLLLLGGHGGELGIYPECNGNRANFKQGNNKTWLILKSNCSGCWVEDGLQSDKKGGKETREEAVGVDVTQEMMLV